MILKHIALYIGLDEYPHDLAVDFGFRTRYICNFLERRLKEERFKADGFSKICVKGKPQPDDSCPILPENAAVPGVLFDQKRYERLRPDERHEFFISMLLEGLKKCAKHHRIPLRTLEGSIDDFRRAGYKNEWVHQSKALREAGIRAELSCRLDAEKFVLTLRLARGAKTIYEGKALETKPDEIIFAYRFKEVVLDKGKVVVQDRFGRPTFSLNLSSIT